MSDSGVYELPDQTANGAELPYRGPLGQTRLESVHWTLPGGRVDCVRVHTIVNAESDPALAERLLAGTLNWVRLEDGSGLDHVAVPVVYHDPRRRLFALVLPEAFRCRELAERAALLGRLAEDRIHAVPRYVRDFEVVYGADRLTQLLEVCGEAGGGATQDESLSDMAAQRSDLEAREAAVLAREAELADREEELVALAAAPRTNPDGVLPDVTLMQRERDLERRETELRGVEQLLLERQGELDRLAEELSHRQDALETGAPPESEAVQQSDEPTKVASREKMERAARASADELDAEEGELSLDPREKPLETDDADLESGPVEAEDLDGLAADDAVAEKAPRRRRAVQEPTETPLAQAVLSVTDDEAEDHAEEPPLEDEEDEVEEAVLPEELAHFKKQDRPEPTLYLRDDKLHLAAVLTLDQTDVFMGTDPVGLIQLHTLPTYPLIGLALVPQGEEDLTAMEELAVFWVLDVLNDDHEEFLDFLAKDFRVQMELYDPELVQVTAREIHFPLEENVKLVRERAIIQVQAAGDAEPDVELATEAFWHGELPRLAATAWPFRLTEYQKIRTPAEALEALRRVGTWLEPEREDELLLRHSFPVAVWRQIRSRITRQAIEFGLWMEERLITLTLDSGFATSRKDLLRGCLAGFERVCSGELPNDLSAVGERDNWTALLAEAERIGVPVDPRWEDLAAAAEARALEETPEEDADRGDGEPGDLGDVSDEAAEDAEALIVDDADLLEEELAAEDAPALQDDLGQPTEIIGIGEEPEVAPDEVQENLEELAPAELIALLGDEALRLEAALELAHRQEAKAIPELFAALERMAKSEAIRFFPHLVGLGSETDAGFIQRLRSGSSLTRMGSALALGALGSEEAVDPLLDLLLDEPTDIWREVARALGDLGPAVMMSLASRIRSADGEQRERLATAMADMGHQHSRDVLLDLSASRDEDAAGVANRALELLKDLQVQDSAHGEGRPTRDKPVLFFSQRFYAALADDERELGEEDIIEAEDIVEENDIVEEAAVDQEPGRDDY